MCLFLQLSCNLENMVKKGHWTNHFVSVALSGGSSQVAVGKDPHQFVVLCVMLLLSIAINCEDLVLSSR